MLKFFHVKKVDFDIFYNECGYTQFNKIEFDNHFTSIFEYRDKKISEILN